MGTEKLLFIYGRLLDPVARRALCPRARVVCAATLSGFALAFAGHSVEWQGSLADLRRERGGKCLGVVFRIDAEELDKMDAEDGGIYTRREFEVVSRNGEALIVDAYVQKNPTRGFAPSGKYLNGILLGYKVYELDRRHFLVIMTELLKKSCRAIGTNNYAPKPTNQDDAEPTNEDGAEPTNEDGAERTI